MGVISRFFSARALSGAAAWTLSLAAAVGVALALCGASGALAFMRTRPAVAFVAIAAAASFAAAARSWRNRPALLMHLGFALALGGWAFNAAFGPEEGYVRLRAGQYGGIGHSGVQHDLPQFVMRLEEFKIDRWPDTGTVRQYTSRVMAGPYAEQDEHLEPRTISVNHPLVMGGWWIYQSSYEELKNPHTGEPLYFTILQCVCDIGLPFAFAGGILLLLGSLLYAVKSCRRAAVERSGEAAHDGCRPYPRFLSILYGVSFAGACAMLVHRGMSTGHAPMQNMYEFLICMAAFIPVLTWLSARKGERTLLQDAFLQALVLVPVAFFMDGRVKRLMPALQSPFFVPHVGAYVLGYVLLVRAALGAGRRLVGVGFFLLTLGLVLGAAWGKVCWGHWWQFDPKEMWSLATWLLYAAYFHLRARLSPRADRAFLVAGAVMVVLTLTWINLSRIFTGMHSYA